MSLGLAVNILVMCCALIAVQLVILTVEIAALKSAINMLLRMVRSLNEAVNPWAAEGEPTEPNNALPPKLPRRRRLSFFIPLLRKKRERE